MALLVCRERASFDRPFEVGELGCSKLVCVTKERSCVGHTHLHVAIHQYITSPVRASIGQTHFWSGGPASIDPHLTIGHQISVSLANAFADCKFPSLQNITETRFTSSSNDILGTGCKNAK